MCWRSYGSPKRNWLAWRHLEQHLWTDESCCCSGSADGLSDQTVHQTRRFIRPDGSSDALKHWSQDTIHSEARWREYPDMGKVPASVYHIPGSVWMHHNTWRGHVVMLKRKCPENGCFNKTMTSNTAVAAASWFQTNQINMMDRPVQSWTWIQHKTNKKCCFWRKTEKCRGTVEWNPVVLDWSTSSGVEIQVLTTWTQTWNSSLIQLNITSFIHRKATLLSIFTTNVWVYKDKCTIWTDKCYFEQPDIVFSSRSVQ